MLQCRERIGETQWGEMFSEGTFSSFVYAPAIHKKTFTTGSRILADKMGEFSWTLFTNSHGHFCPLEFLFFE
jgi:hypothetical protein